MDFKIHNLKLKARNNSCEFVFAVQFQWYTTSPIHLKNDLDQNKDKINYNNNQHKQNTRERENYFWVCQFDCYKLKPKFVIMDCQKCLNIHP
jgi:hypothetical protein